MALLTPGVAYRRSPPRRPEFPMFPPPGRAKLLLSRKPNRALSRQLSRKPSRQLSGLPSPLPRPPYCQPTTEPCPRLIAIRNHPAKQPRRSPSTGSGSSPEIRGLSGIWAHRPAESSQSPRGRRVGGGALLRVTGDWGEACPRAGILVNGRVSDFMSVQGWTVFPALWIPGGQTC